MKKIINLVIITITVGISLQSIYTAFFGVWDPLIHRPLIMGAGVLAALLMNALVNKYPTDSTAKKVLFWTIDLVMLAIILTAIYVFIDVSEELEDGLFELDMSMNYLTLAGILVLCELTRRFIGWPLVAVAGACLIYVLFGENLPGSLRHAGYDVPQTVMQIWFSTAGIFGMAMSVLLNLIFIFIVFGAILQGTGAVKLPGRTMETVQPEAYGKNQVNEKPIRALGVWMGIGTQVGVDAEAVYQTTKAFWEHIDELYSIAVWAKVITRETALSEANMPLHKGAYRYYKEAGFKIPAHLVPSD